MNPESVSMWSNVVSSVGFPIVIAGALLLCIYRMQQAHRAEMKAMRDEQTAELRDIRNEHKQEIKELTKAVDKLSDLVTEFVTIVRSEKNVSDKVGISEKR